MQPETKPCPCGSQKTYENCCAIIHADIAQAKTAEQLMRSRYTAFTMALGEYLVQSHHPTTRNTVNATDLSTWAKSVKWMHLQVLKTNQGTEHDAEGTVEFKAHFRQGLFKKTIHEKSLFKKENNIWYYHSAV